ncbi:Ku protein [Streptomyces sp. NPDC056670]|uniref:non-homologous end joining protein Ku n=1 Tax=Streptomyces sp. NPDC056670 TaxID=3345904 RepID=UPI00369D1E9A
MARVRTKKVCEIDGQTLDWDDIGRGYEVSKDTIVEVTDAELDSMPLPTAKAIEIVAFVPVDSIDPIRVGAGYYRQADGQVAAKSCTLLRQALGRSSKVAVAKFAWHNRERLGLLRVVDRTIALHAMHWDDEVRSPETLAPKAVELTDDEVDAAIQLLETMARVDIDDYTDHYREAVEEMLTAKTEHRKPKPVEGEAPEEAGKVVDLMAALTASMEAAKKARGETGDATPRAMHSTRGGSHANSEGRQPRCGATKTVMGGETMAADRTPGPARERHAVCERGPSGDSTRFRRPPPRAVPSAPQSYPFAQHSRSYGGGCG